jgi:hypothetical protein
VKKEKRVSEIRQHIARELGAFAVILSQQFETSIQPSALLARLEKRDIERRGPAAGCFERLGESAALIQECRQTAKRLTEGAGSGRLLQRVERLAQRNAGRR